jgi:DTW domain-containing protein
MKSCPLCKSTEFRCYCAQIPSVQTRTKFLILQHILEVPKTSNTGRAAARALVNCELRVYGARTVEVEPGTSLLEGFETEVAVLFPTGPVTAVAPKNVVVLDASWSQARRMLQRIPELQRMRRISLDVPAQRQSLRDAPPSGCSTLEALAYFVETAEDRDKGQALHELHARLVQRNLIARGYA